MRPAWLVLLACIAWATPAAANDFVPSVTLQTGATVTRGPGINTDGYFAAATPQLSYFIEGDRKLIQLTYAFTGSIDTVLPNGVSNRLAITTAAEVTPTTRLLFGVEGLQALLGNYILVRRATNTTLGNINSLNSNLLTISANEGLQHELSPRLRLTQLAGASHITSLDDDLELDNTLATASLGLERAFDFNAIGAQLDLQYARTKFPPINSTVYTVAAGPTWDHDFSTNFNMSLAASGQVAASTDANLGARFGPAARATLFYGTAVTGIGLEYAGGIEPNLLIGTLLQSQQATLRAFTPLSEKNKVIIGASGGYLHAETLDLAESGDLDSSFDAVLHDAELTWEPVDFLTLSLRYQFIGQTSGRGPIPTPAIVRHGLIFGIELFASRPGGRPRRVPSRFSQRADGNDPTQPATGAFSSGERVPAPIVTPPPSQSPGP
ncbi:MAG: hypothetical protein KIT84_09735 [Labilithrix sp.]|nr:hypothetical protein [Labilithrix sp.]MCW5811282.1 hypothetical protein [Labilithrix sp.]